MKLCTKNSQKKRNCIREPSITCSHIWHVQIPKCVHLYDTQSGKVWWRCNTSDINARQLCMKIHKNRNTIKEHSIACSHIWHVNISKYVYQLDTHSEKVWWSYVLPNINATHFCDIIFGHRAVFPSCNKKQYWKLKIRPR